MTWHDLLFAHWPVDVADLRRVVPSSLPIDCYEGQAWVGVVPFWMSGVRHLRLPTPRQFGRFAELNVRTYVSIGDRPGVYFFSLDAANRIMVWLARCWFHLPYFYARMRYAWHDNWLHYVNRRAERSGSVPEFRARYRPAGEIFQASPGSLEHWLSERYCLYTVDNRGRPYRAEIHHEPWPLQPAEAEIELNSMLDPVGLELPATAPLLHFARRLDVVSWSLRRASE